MQNKILKLVLSVITVALLGFALYGELTVSLPVLKEDVIAGTQIEADMIGERTYFRWQADKSYITNGMEIVRKVAKIDIPANHAFAASVLEDREAQRNVDNIDMAVIPVAVDSAHVPADLKEGDIVNVIVYFRTEGTSDASMNGIPNFVIGFDELGSVAGIAYDEQGKIEKVDVKAPKEMATEIATAISQGDIYIIRNYVENDITLLGSTLKDIYVKNFHVTVADGAVE